jgi:hypothetical protein
VPPTFSGGVGSVSPPVETGIRAAAVGAEGGIGDSAGICEAGDITSISAWIHW